MTDSKPDIRTIIYYKVDNITKINIFTTMNDFI